MSSSHPLVHTGGVQGRQPQKFQQHLQKSRRVYPSTQTLDITNQAVYQLFVLCGHLEGMLEEMPISLGVRNSTHSLSDSKKPPT